MDVGCSLKGYSLNLNHSVVASFAHFYITYDFNQQSQIWGYICDGNGECAFFICSSTAGEGEVAHTPYVVSKD
jgi:hypothetical protein